MEAIVLAGGLGTRLRSEVNALPKSMAEVGGKPFLSYLFDHLIASGITRIVLSVGYMSEAIETHFGDQYKSCALVFAHEKDRLGTGGAVKNSLPFVKSDDLFILNGDSLYLNDLKAQMQQHMSSQADVTMALKPMKDFDRYGKVDVDEGMNIVGFHEKQSVKEGLINAGVYIINKSRFEALAFPEKFSLEKDFFERQLSAMNFKAVKEDAYFLDIGIPADYNKAQFELGHFLHIQKKLTLLMSEEIEEQLKQLGQEHIKSLGKAFESVYSTGSTHIQGIQNIDKGSLHTFDSKTLVTVAKKEEFISDAKVKVVISEDAQDQKNYYHSPSLWHFSHLLKTLN